MTWTKPFITSWRALIVSPLSPSGCPSPGYTDNILGTPPGYAADVFSPPGDLWRLLVWPRIPRSSSNFFFFLYIFAFSGCSVKWLFINAVSRNLTRTNFNKKLYILLFRKYFGSVVCFLFFFQLAYTKRVSINITVWLCSPLTSMCVVALREGKISAYIRTFNVKFYSWCEYKSIS